MDETPMMGSPFTHSFRNHQSLDDTSLTEYGRGLELRASPPSSQTRDPIEGVPLVLSSIPVRMTFGGVKLTCLTTV